MIRFKAILTRVIKELIRDKRTLALMLFAPILVLTLMNVVFNTNGDTNVTIGLSNTVPSVISDAFPSDQVKIKKFPSKVNEEKAIVEHNLDAFVALNGSTLQVTYENEDPTTTAKVKALIGSVLTTKKMQEMAQDIQKLSIQTGEKIEFTNYEVKNAYVYGNSTSTFFDKIFPVLIGFFVFFFVFLISGIALLRERTSGTLERLLATPVKRSEIVMGYLVGYGLFAILQTLLIIFYSIYVLGLQISGSIGWVLLTTILIALVALSMGIFVSTFANSEFQMIQFIPLVVIPQVFFSGLIPLETMTSWVKTLGYIFPLSYAGKALTAIMVKGQGGQFIWQNLTILLVFIVLFTCLNIIGLKRYRKV